MASLSLTDIDFEAIEKCTDPKRLKKMLAMLKQDGGYYVELMKAAKDRIEKLTGKPVGGTPITAADKQAVAEELLAWEKKMAQMTEIGASKGSTHKAAPPDLEDICEEGKLSETPRAGNGHSNASGGTDGGSRINVDSPRPPAKEEEAASQGSPCSAAAGSTADSHSGKATTAGSNTTTRIQVEVVEDSEEDPDE
ncbi:hypothetical protein cyc_00918 [Cyclospora cayetanensis]|uniref:Uncharacterized protein n=1 Tax=Cyclospora cayetanensis TaxID=88456 RepID=A0A1D3D4X6_9EIME|nr:hypothetical protein cyc_00918 [Cyclospora cayetanensis]